MENFIKIFSPILVVLLTALCATLGWLYKHAHEKNLFIEKQLFEKKYTFYIGVLEFFFNTMRGLKQDDNEIKNKMWEFNKDLYIYAPDDVLITYQNWMYDNRNHDSQNIDRMLKGVCDIIIAIRKDMGHKKTKMNSDNILKHLLLDYDKAKKDGTIK